MSRRFSIPIITVVLYLGLASTALQAGSILYGNNSSDGTPYIFAIDPNSGMILQTYTNLSGDNGRGVAVVGNIIYYTTATSNKVYEETVGGVNMGVAFSVPGATALSAMAYDGTNFYIQAYDGTPDVYKVSPTGQLLGILQLLHCGAGNCDGLEYFSMNGQDYLVSNEHDGCCGGDNIYDLYDLNGTFIKVLLTAPNGTGIAFDGKDFFVSDILDGQVDKYDINGKFVGSISLTGNGSYPLDVEDLSFDYSQTQTPEPGTLALVGTGFLGILGVARRKFQL